MKTIRCKSFVIQFMQGSGCTSQRLLTFDVGDTDYLEVTRDEFYVTVEYVRRLPDRSKAIPAANDELTKVAQVIGGTPPVLYYQPDSPRQTTKMIAWRAPIVFECMYEEIVS